MERGEINLELSYGGEALRMNSDSPLNSSGLRKNSRISTALKFMIASSKLR